MAAAQGDYENVVVEFNGTNYVAIEAAHYSLNVGCGFSVTATQID
jgi:hypothetical protein